MSAFLDSSSDYYVICDGTGSNRAIYLPDALSLNVGHTFYFVNDSSYTVPVLTFDGTPLFSLDPYNRSQFICKDNSSSIGLWVYGGLQGLTGVEGVTGLEGQTGIQGLQGVTGLEGSQGVTGLEGQTGIQGPQGVTGLEGQTGIQGVTGLEGQTGIQGITGLEGQTGIQGVTGLEGQTGIQGPQGVTGLEGQTGIQGTTGLVGTTGLQGIGGYGVPYYFHNELSDISPYEVIERVPGTGADDSDTITVSSTQGYTGLSFGDGYLTPLNDPGVTEIPAGVQAFNIWARANSVASGRQPRIYVEVLKRDATGTITPMFRTVDSNILTTSIALYELNQTLSLPYPIASTDRVLVKPYGKQSATTGLTDITFYYDGSSYSSYVLTSFGKGSQGVTGLEGQTGIQGVTGLEGATGLQGQTGIQGVTGLEGQTGIQGPQGATGLQGQTGIQGPQGATGLQGQTGIQGITGLANFIVQTNYPNPLGVTPILLWNETSEALFVGITGIQHWVQISAGSLQGPTGMGVPGSTGLQGPTGVGVAGAVSSTDNAIVRWDGTSGRVIQNSGVIIDDSNRVSSAKTFTFDAEYLNGNSGTSKTIDWSNGQKQSVTMTASCTFTFGAPAGPSNLVLRCVQDATGGRVATWPSTVYAPGGKTSGLILSTGANQIDLVSMYYNGTNYYATISKNYSA
jgi:hypothetical protein